MVELGCLEEEGLVIGTVGVDVVGLEEGVEEVLRVSGVRVGIVFDEGEHSWKVGICDFFVKCGKVIGGGGKKLGEWVEVGLIVTSV